MAVLKSNPSQSQTVSSLTEVRIKPKYHNTKKIYMTKAVVDYDVHNFHRAELGLNFERYREVYVDLLTQIDVELFTPFITVAHLAASHAWVL